MAVKQNSPEENRKIFTKLLVGGGLLINFLVMIPQPTVFFPSVFYGLLFSILIGGISVVLATVTIIFKSLTAYFYVTAAFIFFIVSVIFNAILFYYSNA
jgi:hypothetical protein